MSRLAVAERSAMLTPVIAHANSGKLRIYSGTRPTNGDTALSSNTLLAELVMAATSFSESGGVLTAGAITSGTAAATGTASFVRLFRSDGTTVVGDFSVATSGSECTINTTSIVSGANVSSSAFTITYGVGA